MAVQHRLQPLTSSMGIVFVLAGCFIGMSSPAV
jgi:hypothetical protein